jgi:peptidoglycan/xylan/chitin deacetylase (PgdA/CDA1 family)
VPARRDFSRRTRRSSLVLPILTYHAIEEGRSLIGVSPAAFRRQVELLAAGGWTALTVPQALDLLQLGRCLPRRVVALTFDDGLRSAYTVALPILREYGFVATIFPVAGALGGSNDWPGQPPGIPALPLLAWDELAALAGAGWAVGGHTLTHPDLTAAPAERAEEEVAGCRHALSERLGLPVTVFAYPYGRHDASTRTMVARHYRGACATEIGLAHAGSDPFALERIDALYVTPAGLMRLLDAPMIEAYLALRRGLRALRAGIVSRQ